MIRLENDLKISLQDVLKTSWQNVLKTSWRRMANTNMLVLTKTSWRRLEDVLWRRRWKTSSRRLQDVFIKTNVCWERFLKKGLKSTIDNVDSCSNHLECKSRSSWTFVTKDLVFGVRFFVLNKSYCIISLCVPYIETVHPLTW